MSRIEPHLVPVLSDLIRGLREIGVDFCVIGALVPELLPFSKAIAPAGYVNLGDDAVLNLAGFNYAVPSAVQVSVEQGLTVPLVPVALYVLLKLVAYGARNSQKDLASVLHCLEHYMDDDERRYGMEHEGELVPFDYTCACLLGLDGRTFDDPFLNQAVHSVLDEFTSPDANIVGVVARSGGRLVVRAEDRVAIFQQFRWFRRGRTR